jgi:hypothetical protein
VEQYLRSVAQIFASMGAKDPRHDRLGNTNLRLSHQFRTYSKQDPLPAPLRDQSL